MDRVTHSKQIDDVHYLHIPVLERTKTLDETQHTPMFRVLTRDASGGVQVDTYDVGVKEPLARHAYRFTLPGAEREEALTKSHLPGYISDFAASRLPFAALSN